MTGVSSDLAWTSSNRRAAASWRPGRTWLYRSRVMLTDARSKRLLPARLRPVAERLEAAPEEVHRGELDPRIATAMASLAGALVRVITSGEVEERLRVLEVKEKATSVEAGYGRPSATPQ